MKKLLNIITEGKYQKFKTLFIITMCTFIVFCILIPSLASDTALSKTMTIFLALALMVEVFYYLKKFSPLKKSIKLSVIDGSLAHIAEITKKDFDSNGRIAFSDHFFYDLKNNFFVAYGSILWVFVKDDGAVIRTANGEKFESQIDYKNLGALMKTYPHIMYGYDSDNYKKYIERVNAFNSRVAYSTETIVFGIPDTINNFWKWLGTKVKTRVFYTIAYSCMALFFIGLIVIASVDSSSARIPGWVFGIWISLDFIGLFCFCIAHKVGK